MISKKLIVTAAANNPDYFKYCMPSQERYAKKIGADYKILGDSDMCEEYPTANFLIFAAYKFAEEYEYEHVMFIDADVIVNPLTEPFWKTFPTGMALRYGWEWEKVAKWARKNNIEEIEDWQERYYSPGLGVADRASVIKLNEVAKPPFHKGAFAGGGNLEQFNYCVARAGIDVTPMPAHYHFSRHWPLGKLETRGEMDSGDVVESLDDVSFLHYPGGPKLPKILKDGLWKQWSI